jgi:hypothetical protein
MIPTKATTELIYIGGGYWRAKLVFDQDDYFDAGVPARVVGLRLINPDRTPQEIETVERGICVLMRLKYPGDPQ